MTKRTDRIAALLLAALALGYGLMARRFSVTGLADPLGPKAFPLSLAALLGLTCLVLILRPEPVASFPGRGAIARIFMALVVMTLFAALLQPLGFILAAALTLTALGFLFDGPWRPLLMASLLLSLAAYALFEFGLGVRLPAGFLFEGL